MGFDSKLAGLLVVPEMVDMSMTLCFGPLGLSVNRSDTDILLFIQYNGFQTCHLL